MKASGRVHESGFTLLEVLVALAILAVGIALTLSLISGALANIRKVQLRTRTIQHAQTVLELALLDDNIRRPTRFTGDFEDGTRWSVQVEEVPDPKPLSELLPNAQQVQLPIKLFAYTVEVMAPDSRAADFRLQTLKIVNIQQPEGPMRMPQ
ncbi:MAG TPA: type II secretion system protein [Acidobacteriota bacterium]|nr:type II secretion system protein [Acidobacteriota bacterium]